MRASYALEAAKAKQRKIKFLASEMEKRFVSMIDVPSLRKVFIVIAQTKKIQERNRYTLLKYIRKNLLYSILLRPYKPYGLKGMAIFDRQEPSVPRYRFVVVAPNSLSIGKLIKAARKIVTNGMKLKKIRHEHPWQIIMVRHLWKSKENDPSRSHWYDLNDQDKRTAIADYCQKIAVLIVENGNLEEDDVVLSEMPS